MIKIVSAVYDGNYRIFCEFSDGSAGTYDLESLLLSHETPLTKTLRDTVTFAGFFIQSGALCWKNGLEFDPVAIYREMEQAGTLFKMKKAA